MIGDIVFTLCLTLLPAVCGIANTLEIEPQNISGQGYSASVTKRGVLKKTNQGKIYYFVPIRVVIENPTKTLFTFRISDLFIIDSRGKRLTTPRNLPFHALDRPIEVEPHGNVVLELYFTVSNPNEKVLFQGLKRH